MQLDDPLIVAPALEEAIDRHPLTVAPTLQVIKFIL